MFKTSWPRSRPPSSTFVAAAGPPLQIGFVYVTPLTSAGCTSTMRAGAPSRPRSTPARCAWRRASSRTSPGPDAERVIRDLVRQGCQLIITPSFGYMEPTLRVAQEFPGALRVDHRLQDRAPNVAVANARYARGSATWYGGRPAHVTHSHVAGYVAGFPIPEVLQGINAFIRWACARSTCRRRCA